MRRTIPIVLFTAAMVVINPGPAQAGGGGGAGGSGPCAPISSGSNLDLRDYCIDGVAHFAAAGSTLVVTNEGQHAHSLTAADGTFDTGLLAPGEAAEIELGGPGIVTVFCKPHGAPEGHGMAGVLIVGNPAPAAMGTTATGREVSTELAEHDRTTGQALGEQSQRLDSMEAQLTRLQNKLRAAMAGLVALVGMMVSAFVLRARRHAFTSPDPAPQARPASAASD